MKMMLRLCITTSLVFGVGEQTFAASVTNHDSEPRTLRVTEAGNQIDLVVAGGETVEFCQSGCFVTLPNGDREALTGNEVIEISNGIAKVR